MDILEKVGKAMNGKHEWERVPFSTHHGWDAPDWVCQKCGATLESVEEECLPVDGCHYHPPELIAELAEEVRRLRG